MMRYFLCDLKRVFESRAMVALCALAPVAVMLLFSSIVAPLLFAAEVTSFNVAILNEDGSRPVNQFINQLVNSQALKDLVTSYPVDSAEQGWQLLRQGDVLVLVHVPAGFFETMERQGETGVTLYGLPGHHLETALIRMTLESALATVGKSQNLIASAQELIVEKGIPQASADIYIADTTDYAINAFMDRRQVLGQQGNVSPLGEYLPTEYYLGAIFALFSAMAAIPLIRLTAADLTGAVMQRGLLAGSGLRHYYGSRLVSGAALISLVLLMVFPTAAVTRWLNLAIQITFSQSLWALGAAVLLSALCFSAAAIAVAAFVPDEDGALWVAFYGILIMALLSGVVLPEAYLPEGISALGRTLPLRAAMRAMVSALFRFDPGLYWPDMLRLALWTGLLTAVGVLGLDRRRGRL